MKPSKYINFLPTQSISIPKIQVETISVTPNIAVNICDTLVDDVS